MWPAEAYLNTFRSTYHTPNLYNLLEASSDASSSDRIRWNQLQNLSTSPSSIKSLLLQFPSSGKLSLPSSGNTETWWAITMAIASTLAIINKITTKRLKMLYDVMNILDSTIGGDSQSIRGTASGTWANEPVTREEQHTFIRLKLLMRSLGLLDVFKTDQITRNMTAKQMFKLGNLDKKMKELCKNVEQGEEAYAYFQSVLKFTRRSRSDGLTGRRLSFG